MNMPNSTVLNFNCELNTGSTGINSLSINILGMHSVEYFELQCLKIFMQRYIIIIKHTIKYLQCEILEKKKE